jgi:hypothetical protein
MALKIQLELSPVATSEFMCFTYQNQLKKGSPSTDTQIFSRFQVVGTIPQALLGSTLDIATGALPTITAILTAGRDQSSTNYAYAKLNDLSLVPSILFNSVLRLLRPSTDIGIGNLESNGAPDGRLTSYFKGTISEKCAEMILSDSFFKRHIVARAGYLLLAIVCVISRVADLAIGLIAVIGALWTLGYSPSINREAFRGLRFLGVITDVVGCAIQILNPSIWNPFFKDYNLENVPPKRVNVASLNGHGIARGGADNMFSIMPPDLDD